MSAAKYFLFPLALGSILVANAYFVSHLLYIEFWWLDSVLHAIGGFFLAAFYRSFISRESFLGLSFFLFILGIIWEVLEYFFAGPFFGTEKASIHNALWILDTLKDILVDIVSGMLWWRIASSYNRSNV